MKIGINTWWIDNNRAGITSYSYNLCENLIRTGNAEDLYFFHEAESKNPMYSKVHEIQNPVRLPKPLNLFGLPLALNKYDIDIFHSLAPFYTDFLPFMLNTRTKKILTLHDFAPIIYPKTHNRKDVIIWNTLIHSFIKNADFFISVSENTKKDCMRIFDIPDEKIRVIPLAPNKVFRQLDKTPELKEKISKKYNIRFPYLLYVGTLEARKNIPNLLRAFAQLKSIGFPHKMVIAGMIGWKYQNIFSIIDNLGIKDEVIFTGFIDYEDLPVLYNFADVFVYPSLFEGFGLPPLEAMSCGTPVVTSNISSLPEVVGDAAITINPGNVEELAAAIQNILSDEDLRQRMHEHGIARAKEFNWTRTAEETWNVYELVMES